jgi:hypothetical protein
MFGKVLEGYRLGDGAWDPVGRNGAEWVRGRIAIGCSVLRLGNHNKKRLSHRAEDRVYILALVLRNPHLIDLGFPQASGYCSVLGIGSNLGFPQILAALQVKLSLP